jgi:hypothetical protein
MELLYELFKLFIICFVLTDMASFIGELINELEVKRRVLKIIKHLVSYVLTCPRCFTFWLSLIMTGDLFISASLSLLINLAKELQYKLKSKTEL